MKESTQLLKTVDQFCQVIAGLPASALKAQDWGPKEVLAHLVYHHELYVRLVDAFLSGLPVDPLGGRFKDLNARAVLENRETSVPELIKRFRFANGCLINRYLRHDPNKITIKIKAGAKIRTLAELVPEVEAHIRNHLEKLRKAD